ncbi:MAG: DegV family protein [Schaedlerella sp.]|nr:DegV family protein [Schaedlerella sp.]
MGIRIIADSASDMSEKESKYLKILPLTVQFGDTEYQDGVTLSAEEFYKKLEESNELPKTSQVTPFAFEEALREALDAGDTPIVITISSKLSGTYNSAVVAASEFEEEINIIDSANVCAGERILIEYALRLIEEGKTAEEIVKALENVKERACLIAAFDTLEYLRRGGRISNIEGVLGGMLSIKPVLGVKDGALESLGKARGSKNAANLLLKQIEEAGGIDHTMPFVLVYSGLDDTRVRKFAKDNEAIFKRNAEDIKICIVGSTVGTHAGPGALGAIFFKAEK